MDTHQQDYAFFSGTQIEAFISSESFSDGRYISMLYSPASSYPCREGSHSDQIRVFVSYNVLIVQGNCAQRLPGITRVSQPSGMSSHGKYRSAIQ